MSDLRLRQKEPEGAAARCNGVASGTTIRQIFDEAACRLTGLSGEN